MKRFLDKVDRSGGPDACHPWTAGTDRDGYGKFKMAGRDYRAHRVAFFVEHGRWPECGRHTCDNPPCCNPAHVVDGSNLRNRQDSVERQRHAHGASHGMAKLDAAAVTVIRALHHWSGFPQRAIAKEFGITQASVSLIVRGEVWRHIPFAA